MIVLYNYCLKFLIDGLGSSFIMVGVIGSDRFILRRDLQAVLWCVVMII